MASGDLTQSRIAENQSMFRGANEQIEAAAQRNVVDGEVPFICECADVRCTEIVSLGLDVYTEIRRHPRRFVTAPGHEAMSVESGAGVVVSHGERYVLVDKVGVAGELAERLADKAE
jgi:hypothetical protein